MRSSGQTKTVDLMAGSEKILRVHHRNMVHARYLQHSLNDLDAVCKRNLNKVQQEIYNVYYSEFLPLRESKRKLEDSNERPSVRKGIRRFEFAVDGKVKQKCTLPEIKSDRSTYGSLSTLSTTSITRYTPLPSIFDKSRKRDMQEMYHNRQPTLIPLSSLLKLPKEERSLLVGKWKEDFKRVCPSVVSRSDQDGSPNIDNDRLKIIRSAIALSSQPAPDIENSRKNRKLRKSFLVNLRRQSNAGWNNSAIKVLKENGPLSKRRTSHTKLIMPSSRRNSATSIKSQIKQSLIEDNDATGVDDKTENLSGSSSKSSIAVFTENLRDILPRASGATFNDFSDEDAYSLESPNVFSEIDEEPSSYEDSEYDDSSYTSTSSSSYWEYSDDAQSFTDSEG